VSDQRPPTGTDPVAAFHDRYPGADVELGYAGVDTFLKADQYGFDELAVDAAVVGVPFDGATSNRPGARYGPRAIRAKSGWWAYLSGYKGGLTNMQTGRQVDFSQFTVADCGDVPVFPTNLEQTAESIRAHVAAVASQTFPVLLGGDHYCTYPAFCGFATGAGHDRVGLVQIDAHTDTVAESAVFGTDFHGSSTNRIATSEHSDYDAIAQIGIRGYESPDFFEFADDEGLAVFTARTVEQRGIEPVVRDAIEAASDGTDAVYVTFDIDAVDPSAAPGTGTPVPGGFSSDQALRVMEILGQEPAVGMVDMMEVAPPYDHSGETARLAASLLVTFLEHRFGTATHDS